jgi:hypothetical protein
MTIDPGIYKSSELHIEDYHADKALGSSLINNFDPKAPGIWYSRFWADNAPGWEETEVQKLGSMAHIAMLEPDKFLQIYAVAPATYIKNEGKKNEEEVPLKDKVCAGWKKFKKETEEEGKIPILLKEAELARDMFVALTQNKIAASMLTGGIEECSFFAKCDQTGLMLKARPDYIVDLEGIGKVIVDYKTTGISLDLEEQSKHTYNLKRHIQAAHHKYVVEKAASCEVSEVCYVVQQTVYPYPVRAFLMPKKHVEIGRDESVEKLQAIADCMAKNSWPYYPEELTPYEAPAWFNYKYE